VGYIEEREYRSFDKAYALLDYLHCHAGKSVDYKQVRDALGIDRYTLRRLLLSIEYSLGHKVTVRSGRILYVDKDD
jgi:DNA-directed RNA polymerase subunit N (RpoN/RPB10)